MSYESEDTRYWSVFSFVYKYICTIFENTFQSYQAPLSTNEVLYTINSADFIHKTYFI